MNFAGIFEIAAKALTIPAVLLLAQDSASIDSWFPGGSPGGTVLQGGAIALLAWHVWYTTSKTIPGLCDDNRAATKEIIDNFREDMRVERELRREELENFRCKGKGAVVVPESALNTLPVLQQPSQDPQI